MLAASTLHLQAERPAGVARPTAVVTPTGAPSGLNRTVKISLRTSPREAHVRIDDGPASEGPYEAYLSRSEIEHNVLVSAPGFRDHLQKLRFDRDLDLEIKLETAPSTEHVRGSKAAPPSQPANVTIRPDASVPGSTEADEKAAVRESTAPGPAEIPADHKSNQPP